MSCGITNTLSNFLGGVIVVAITPLMDTETKRSAKIAIWLQYAVLAFAFVAMAIASIIQRSRNNKKTNEK